MGSKQSLANVNAASIDTVPFKNIRTKCKITNVHDGDTCTIVFRFGTQFMKLNVRLKGLDAPEFRARPLETKAGYVVQNMLDTKLRRQKYWYVEMSKWDKYGGRVIGELFDSVNSENSVNTWLLKLGVVKPYNGEKKSMWTDRELKKIINMDIQ